MRIPRQIPGLKLFSILLGIYAAIWISLEGSLGRELVMGVGVTAVSLLYLLQKRYGSQTLPLKNWLITTTICGFSAGLASGPLTMAAMVVKTGLHAHGPEFTVHQIQWVWQHIPLWAVVGLLTGLSLGLLTANQAKE